jgi:hypothetical protein
MATGFALLSMDKNIEPLYIIGTKMGMEATVLPEPKINGRKGLIIRKKNPDDGRGVLIYLTELGEKETYQKTLF